MKTLITTLILLFSFICQGEICKDYLTLNDSEHVQIVVKNRFPNGFWQNQNNLNQIVKILLTSRASAFLHDLKEDDFLDLQNQLIEAFGVSGLTGKKLSTNIRTLRLTDMWALALDKNGHPKSIKEQSQQRVIEIIKYRLDRKLSLKSGDVLADHSSTFLDKLESVFNEKITAVAYIQRAAKAFGSWRKAIESSKLVTPNAIVNSWSPSPKEIVLVLENLIKADIDVSSQAFRNNKDPKVLEIIKNTIGRNLTAYQIYYFASQIKSWGLWAEDLNLQTPFDSRNLTNHNFFLTDDEIIKVIQAADEDGKYSLNFTEVSKNTDKEGELFIQSIIGIKITFQRLYYYSVSVSKNKKSWDYWLEQAGLDLKLIKKSWVFFTDEEVLQVIKNLHMNGVLLNASEISKDSTNKSSQIIFETLGVYRKANSIYKTAINKKPWSQWLTEAGLDIRKIQKSNNPLLEQEIIEVIKKLHARGVPLNSRSIQMDASDETQSIIEQVTRLKMTGSAFYLRASKLKRWMFWLSDACLDVTQIQLHGKIPYNLVNEITKASLRQADSSREAMLGNTSAFQSLSADQWERIQVEENDGEALIIRKEFDGIFENFFNGLTEFEQDLMKNLIDGLENGVLFPDLINELIISHGTEAQETINNLFIKIKNNPLFIELILGNSND